MTIVNRDMHHFFVDAYATLENMHDEVSPAYIYMEMPEAIGWHTLSRIADALQNARGGYCTIGFFGRMVVDNTNITHQNDLIKKQASIIKQLQEQLDRLKAQQSERDE